MTNTFQSERSFRLYGDKPIVLKRSQIPDILKYYQTAYTESENHFRSNYEDSFLTYLANYRGISTRAVKPWDEANEYFMPATNINVENYTTREMGTLRGAHHLVTVLPTGRDDDQKAKTVELYLRYMFEKKMRGFVKLNDTRRQKNIYGTVICSMPWEIDIVKDDLEGKYLFDKSVDDWVRESLEESQVEGEAPAPKDFSQVEIEPILESFEDYEVKALEVDQMIKDQPELEVLDIFGFKTDPSGGTDIQKHAYSIIETSETMDEIMHKVRDNKYDSEQVKKLKDSISDSERTIEFEKNNHHEDSNKSQDARDALDGLFSNKNVARGIRIWICYGRHDLGKGYEEETITIIAGKTFVLRMARTPFKIRGKTFRPLLADRFITMPHRFYGIGIGELLDSQNALLNHLVNNILNHQDWTTSPPIITPLDGDWDPEHAIFGPAQNWPTDNPEGFKVLNLPDIKPSMIAMVQFVEGFIQKSLGINDFTLGGQGNIVNNQTAHGLANILRETSRRIDSYSQVSQETFLKDMFEMILMESQLFLDKTEIPKITDIEEEFKFEDVLNEDIQGFYDIEIRADSVSASREFEQLSIQNLIQVLSQVKGPGGSTLYDMQKLGDKLLEANQFEFPEKFHYDPKKDPLAQATGQVPPGADTHPTNPETKTEIDRKAEGALGPIK